jgi:hypothetical protein
MKKTLLGIVLSAAMLPLTFAATQAANPPASQAGQSSSTTKTKKHTKKTKKTKGTKGEATTTNPPKK